MLWRENGEGNPGLSLTSYFKTELLSLQSSITRREFSRQRDDHVLSRFSRVRLCATLWTIACQAPLSMGFSRQEY